MAKIKSIALTTQERTALENGWRRDKSPALRQRCRIVLLKAQTRTSKDVAAQVGCCEMAVSTWLKRYQAEGIAGLQTREGQGRRPILNTEEDLAAVRRAVQHNRQRVSLARAELTQELGKGFSDLTLRRFLKNTVGATNAFDAE